MTNWLTFWSHLVLVWEGNAVFVLMLQQRAFSSFIELCGQQILRGKGKILLHNGKGLKKKKRNKRYEIGKNSCVHLTLSWHFWVCTLSCVFHHPAEMERGREKRCGEAGRREGRTLVSHLANSLQPTLPSQCYTYSTSPKALNIPLSLNRTNTQPSAHSAPPTEHLLSLLAKHGVCGVFSVLLWPFCHLQLSAERAV